MRLKLASCVMAGALVLAACGGDDDDTQASDTTEADSGSATTAADAAAGPITTAETDLGEVLVDADGMTLYVFTNDTDGVSTCTGDCAGTWPALTVDSADLPEGLDAAVFSVAERSDGTFQLVAGDFPLYRFASDTPGDTNGQGSGGVWFVVAPDGSLIKGDAPAPAAERDPAPEDPGDDSGY